jgi:hypothetical protein
MKPNWWRGGAKLRATSSVIDRLPAHVKMRAYFPDGGYRYPYIKVGSIRYDLGQTYHATTAGAMGMTWTYDGRQYSLPSGLYVTPQNQWLVADVWMTESNVTGEFNGVTTSADMPVKEMLAASSGAFGLEFGVGDDYSTKGAWIDYILVEQAPADSQPPVTSAALAGTEGNAGWFRSEVAVTLTAADADSGVAATEYSLDGGATWVAYAGPFTIAEQGVTQLQFRSTDVAANVETPNSLSVAIDSIAPAVSIASPAGRYIVGQEVVVDWSAVDGGSGIASVDAFAKNGSIIQIVPGTLTGTVTATDEAGNTAAASTAWQGAYNVKISRLRGKKAGSALPLKVVITDAQGRAVRRLQPVVQFAKATASVFETARVPSGKRPVALRERRAGVYHGVWKTPRVPGTYTLRIVIDGLAYDSVVTLR